MKTIDLDKFREYLLEHRVSEEKIAETSAKARAINAELDEILHKVMTARDFRTANLALKKTKGIERRFNSLIAEVLEDAKHEVMSKNARKKGGEDEHE